jgi:hypothetical protein
VALFNPQPLQKVGVQKIINKKETNMKKIIVTLGCMLIAPLAFAQPSSTNNRQGTTTAEPIKVTGTIIKTTTEEGAAASYQPAKTLVVREDRANYAGRYVLNGRGHVVNKAGEVVQTAIKPGTRVRVYYANMGDLRMIDHVVVVD